MPLSEVESADLVKQIMGVAGMGIVAQQIGIAAAKVFFPIVGGLATIPVVFSLTYGIGKAMDVYLTNKAAGKSMNQAELKTAWESAKAEGDAEAARRGSAIKDISFPDENESSRPSLDATHAPTPVKRATSRIRLSDVLAAIEPSGGPKQLSATDHVSREYLSLHEQNGVQQYDQMAMGPWPTWQNEQSEKEGMIFFHTVLGAAVQHSVPFGFVFASFTDATYMSHLYALAGRLELQGSTFEEQCNSTARFLRDQWEGLADSQRGPYLRPADTY